MPNLRSWRLVNDNVEVLIDGNWGNLIPQHFAKNIYEEKDWQNINPQDIQNLKDTPQDNPTYQQSWTNILTNATCTHKEYPGWQLRFNSIKNNLYIVASEKDWQEYLEDDSLE
jgi:hypothetical protein